MPLRLDSLAGIASSSPVGGYIGSAPTASGGDLPISAVFHKKDHQLKVRTITVVSLSAFVLLLILIGAFYIFLKRRKLGRSSTAVGPAFTSSISKRSVTFLFLVFSKLVQC